MAPYFCHCPQEFVGVFSDPALYKNKIYRRVHIYQNKKVSILNIINSQSGTDLRRVAFFLLTPHEIRVRDSFLRAIFYDLTVLIQGKPGFLTFNEIHSTFSWKSTALV